MPRLLTETADYNLWIIKRGHGNAARRLVGARSRAHCACFGADRALLLTEAVLLAKMVMVAAGYPFVLAGRGVRARWRRRGPAPVASEDRVLVTDRRPS